MPLLGTSWTSCVKFGICHRVEVGAGGCGLGVRDQAWVGVGAGLRVRLGFA